MNNHASTFTQPFAQPQALAHTPQQQRNKRTRQAAMYPDEAQSFLARCPNPCLCYDLENGLILVTWAE